jgi:hypothetical protein
MGRPPKAYTHNTMLAVRIGEDRYEALGRLADRQGKN